jgi:hypothetical protein
MKKLLLKILFFLFPLLSVCIFVEYMLQNIPNDYKIKAENLKLPSDYKILCLGESHAFSGINPAYFSLKGFNGSHFSQTLNYDYEILNKFQNNLNQLKYILIPISYASFTNRIENQWETKNYYLYYHIYKHNNPCYYTEIFSLPFEINFGRLISYYYNNESPITTDNLGYSIIYKSNPGVDFIETAKNSASIQTANNYNNWNKNNISLQYIINLCKKRNITVILFTPPAHKYYRDNLNALQLKRTLSKANKYHQTYTNVYYFNFLSDPDFTEDDFFDADHFNSNGAKKLTKKINNIINRIETYHSYP